MARRRPISLPVITPKSEYEIKLEVNLFGFFKLLEETKWDPSKECDRIEGRKSSIQAIGFRENADRLLEVFGNNHLQIQAALTKAISLVRPNTLEECSLFAKRSSLWYKLGRYESSLVDSNRALKCELCPEDLKDELKNRRKDCLKKIKKENEIRIAVVKKMFDEGSFAKQFPMIFNGFFIPLEVQRDHLTPRYVDVYPEGLSEAVRVMYHSAEGRFLMATRDIKPGEIISKEEMFACTPYPLRGLTNCGYCLIKCDASFPCNRCTYEVYCSEDCRRKAYESYHRIECRIKPYCMKLMGPEDCALILALRALLHGTKQGATLRQLMYEDCYSHLFDEELRAVQKISSSNKDYAVICNLEGKTVFLSGEDVINCTKVVILLRFHDFFPTCCEMNECYVDFTGLSKMELFTMKLLVKHLLSIKSNSFVVAEYTNDTPFTSELPSCSRVGESLVCYHSMVNHSCNPNAAEFTRGRNHFLYAIQPIREHEQVFISYNYCHYDTDLKARREKQAHYGFECGCQACILDWPKYEELALRPPVYMTDDINRKLRIEVTDKLMWGFSQPGSFNRSDTVLKSFREICDHCYETNAYVSKPSAMIVRSQVLIERCMRTLSNYYIEYFTRENYDDSGNEEESEYGVEKELEVVIEASRQRRRRGWRRFLPSFLKRWLNL